MRGTPPLIFYKQHSEAKDLLIERRLCMSIIESRVENALKRENEKREREETIRILKSKGYSDQMIGKIVKLPVSEIRLIYMG